ncbi:hypothetical protein HDU96_010380, partial [Phlyctochytrium bullatum]
LANDPIFALSGITAGVLLEASTPEGQHMPGTWSIARFWLKKLGSIVPAVLSCFGAILVSRFAGDVGVQYGRFTHLFGVILDSQFYLLAPWAFKYLHRSHRGAAPRLVVASALVSGILGATTSLLFNLHVPRADGIPWAHALTGGLTSGTAQVPLRFPAFLAGLALAVERHRPGKGPSAFNQAVGAAVAVGLWTTLLLTPPDLGVDALTTIVAAFRYPMATLATYFALRPIVAFPPDLAKSIPWRRKLHNVLSHPITESVTLVTLTAEMIHREVVAQLLGLMRVAGALEHVEPSDPLLLSLWAVAAGISGALGYAIYVAVQAPSLGFVRKMLEKRWKKGK